MTQGRAEGVFQVSDVTPVELELPIAAPTAMQTGLLTMRKRYSGQVEGHSATAFLSALDSSSGAGTYVALEAFDGSLNGVSGAFNFAHVASTHGDDRYNEIFLIVPDSGTGGLTGVTGSGGMDVEKDGTHRIWFDYQLP